MKSREETSAGCLGPVETIGEFAFHAEQETRLAWLYGHLMLLSAKGLTAYCQARTKYGRLLLPINSIMAIRAKRL